MTAPTVDDGQAATTAGQPIHVTCCDPIEALCGAIVVGRPDAADDAEVTCQLCAIAFANVLPCANPACPEPKGADHP
ncbi:hypothetical protein [Micromonospora robiginosa]|uniref:Uncharacterized protein n=1 Tax=Micromonospora robiginosa TaxID=2749844 RepID=A0A7L6B7V2_9ACTN|nr:hypothetical protein [Micromonospora ferruginea]QLQ37958.1 hypothetical protein H1D33_03430 [Micromonospora ferruginea]